MKILVISNFYPPHLFGGYEIQCQTHVEALRQRGHEVTVLTSRHGGPHPDDPPYVWRRLDYTHPTERPPLAFWPRHLDWRVVQFLRVAQSRINARIGRAVVAQVRPDVAFVWNMNGVGITAALAAQRAGVPLAYSIGGYWLRTLRQQIVGAGNPIRRGFRTLVYGLSDFAQLDTRHMQVISPMLARQYAEAGFAPDSMTVIPRGIPDEIFVAPDDLVPLFAALPEHRIRLVYAGRIAPEKGIETALHSLASLISQPAYAHSTLDILGLGAPDYEQSLRQLAHELGVAERVHWRGQVPRADLLDRLLAYDALLFPSVWAEPLGVMFIEAMARGLPVIATNQGGPADYLEDGQTGLLVPVNDALAMTQAVARLASDLAEAEALRRRALAYARRVFDFRQTHDQIERFLLNCTTL